MTDLITTILLGFAVFCMAATPTLRIFRYLITLQKDINLLIETNRMQLLMLQHLGAAAISNLWKIRNDIYNWKCQWINREEYEAANQAQMMIADIEKQIELLSKIIKDDEGKDN